MIKYYILLLIMTFIGSLASMFLKKASNANSIKNLIKNKNIYFGGILYLISALLNIYLLKYLDYKLVLPMTSITYIWTLFLSYKILKEHISRKQIIGVFCIITGVVFLIIK